MGHSYEGNQPAILRVTSTSPPPPPPPPPPGKPPLRPPAPALFQRFLCAKCLGSGAPHFPLGRQVSEDGDEWMYGRVAAKATNNPVLSLKIDLTTHRYLREDTFWDFRLLVSVAIFAALIALGRSYPGLGSESAARRRKGGTDTGLISV